MRLRIGSDMAISQKSRNSKSQIPNPKSETRSPTPKAQTLLVWNFPLRAWNLFGIWSFEFQVSFELPKPGPEGLVVIAEPAPRRLGRRWCLGRWRDFG